MLKNTTSRIKLAVFLFGMLALISTIHQARTEEPAIVRARIDIRPDSLHLRCPRNLIACFIELPQGYRPVSINVSSIRLNRTFAPMRPLTIGDYDNDGIPDLQIMFDRAPIIRYIMHSANFTQALEQGSVTATLTVTGWLNDGTAFRGTDTIKTIIQPARGAL